MKKHVSLFLALLLLFSALLAFPAEAVQTEQTKDYALTLSDNQEVQAPRATDLYSAGDSVMYVPGNNDSCSHPSYRYEKWNSSRHKRICTKCGYTVTPTHNFRYSYSGNKCYKYCKDCQYGYNIEHDKDYRYSDGYCQKYCRQCKHIFANESHSYPTTWDTTSTMHKRYCTKCHTAFEQGAHCSFENYTKIDENKHTKYCGVCGKDITENHTINGYSYEDNEHCKVECICGHYRYQAHKKVTIDGEEYCQNCHEWIRN